MNTNTNMSMNMNNIDHVTTCCFAETSRDGNCVVCGNQFPNTVIIDRLPHHLTQSVALIVEGFMLELPPELDLVDDEYTVEDAAIEAARRAGAIVETDNLAAGVEVEYQEPNDLNFTPWARIISYDENGRETELLDWSGTTIAVNITKQVHR